MSRTNFCLDFDSNVKWSMQLRLKPSMVSLLLEAQQRGQEIKMQYSADGSVHVLAVGDTKYNITSRGEESNNHTVCSIDRDWAQGRAQEVGVVKMRGEVQSTFEEKAASMATAKNTTSGNVGKRIRQACKPAQPVGSKLSAAGRAEASTRIPSLNILSPPRTNASSPPAQNAQVEHKESRGPSPAPQRATPARLTDADGAIIEKVTLDTAVREAARRGQLRACALAYIAANNSRVRRKVSNAIQQCFRDAKKNGVAPGQAIVDGVVNDVTQMGRHGLQLTAKAQEELLTKVLPSLAQKEGGPSPPTASAKTSKVTKKPKSSPKTQAASTPDLKGKRPRSHAELQPSDKAKPNKHSDAQATGTAEPKPKKHKLMNGATRTSTGSAAAAKPPRPEKPHPRPTPTATKDSPPGSKPQNGTVSKPAREAAPAQPKPRPEPRPAADTATPRHAPQSQPAPPAPKPASNPRLPARSSTAPQPESARSTPSTPAASPLVEVAEAAPPAAAPAAPERTARLASPAPPKVPAEALMDQYPPKVAAELLEGMADEMEEDTARPLPAWCEAADEGAGAAPMQCDGGAGMEAAAGIEPASPGSNESEPRCDSEMRGSAGGGDPSVRRRTRGQRTPNYCEDSDDDFAIDTTPVARPVGPAVHAAGEGGEGAAYAARAHEAPAQPAAAHPHAAAPQQSVAAAQPAALAGVPPLALAAAPAPAPAAAPCAVHCWAPSAPPEPAPEPAAKPLTPRDGTWFRKYADAVAALRAGQAVPPLDKSEIPHVYEAYTALASEVQAQTIALEGVNLRDSHAPLSPHEVQLLHEFSVNQQYWEDAALTLAALHKQLHDAHVLVTTR
eukprot:jgi/Ulvmu1/10346/UM061_0029.1